MSESYPKSSIWPFVLSGMVLFGLALVPPSKLAPELRRLYDVWIDATASPPTTVTTPKLISHEPPHADQKLSQTDRAGFYPEIAPAPTSNVTKESHAVRAALPDPARRQAAISTGEPAEQGQLRQIGRPAGTLVWQPPSDWQPSLIEPFSPSHAPEVRTSPAESIALITVPISKPVARLEKLQKTPNRQRSPIGLDESPSLSPSTTVTAPDDPVDQPHDLEGRDEGTRVERPQTEPTEANDLQDETATEIACKSLTELLQLGKDMPRLEKWVSQLDILVEAFCKRPLSGEEEHGEIVGLLAKTARYPVDIRSWSLKEQETYWRIRHAVERRTDIWQQLLSVAAYDQAQADRIGNRLRETAGELRRRWASDSDLTAWRDYLELDALIESDQPHIAAESTLVRLKNQSLTPAQRSFLDSEDFRSFEEQLRTAVARGVSSQDIFDALERYETRADIDAANRLLIALQRFSNGSETERYARTMQAIDLHYRNANLRMSVSEDLINRFVPAAHQYFEQVNDTILGASVRGRNATMTNLSVRLIPDETSIRIGFLANGQVHSNTASRKGPVVFYNRGQSQFSADKELMISPHGIYSGPTRTRATTGNRVVGMETDWDEIPLIGWLIRSFARQQHDEQRPFVRAEILSRVRNKATNKLDTEVNRRMVDAEQRVKSRVIEPLERMQLDPRAMEMRTTADRVIMRTRLAGPMQLGAHTPRPRALRSNKLSIQVHQSAANNLIDRLKLNGRSMTLGALAEDLVSRFDLQLEIPEKRRSIIVEFGQDRPIEFDFRDGKVEVTIHFARLDNGSEQWTNFSVRGFYRADARRMDVELIRDGSIELITESLRLRDQIALRSIFTKVFDSNQRLDLLRRAIRDQPKLRQLEVSRVVIRDGWVSLSIGETTSPSTMASGAVAKRQ